MLQITETGTCKALRAPFEGVQGELLFLERCERLDLSPPGEVTLLSVWQTRAPLLTIFLRFPLVLDVEDGFSWRGFCFSIMRLSLSKFSSFSLESFKSFFFEFALIFSSWSETLDELGKV